MLVYQRVNPMKDTVQTPPVSHHKITQKSSFEARASSKSSPGTRTGRCARSELYKKMVYICIFDGKIMGKLWFMACLWFIYHYIFILNGKIKEYWREDYGWPFVKSKVQPWKSPIFSGNLNFQPLSRSMLIYWRVMQLVSICTYCTILPRSWAQSYYYCSYYYCTGNWLPYCCIQFISISTDYYSNSS